MATRISPPPPSPPSPPPPPPATPAAPAIFAPPCSGCSVACPEFCLPPPPFFPYRYPDDPPSTDDPHPLSPLLIALISILAAAFLLVSYYACSRSSFFRRSRENRHHNRSSDLDLSRTQQAVLDPNTGLDESMINRIALLKYRKNDGLVVSTDCSVCLGEFREEESLRLLPECTHAFHVECIDKWLEAHSNCPICRTGVISVPQPIQARPVPAVPVLPVPRGNVNNGGNNGGVNGGGNGGVNSGNNGGNNGVSVNNRALDRIVVIVDPGQVGRVQEIIEEAGDETGRPGSRELVFVGRDMKPIKSNLMR